MNLLDPLDPRFTTILCDVWGVIHDGARLFPGARARLLQWTGEGRRVVLITNAPRPASTVAAQLARLGLPNDAWHAIASSGAAGIAALTSPPRPVGFLGTAGDRADLVDGGVILTNGAFNEVAVAGLEHDGDGTDAYRQRLREWAARDVLFHCLNPDRLVIHRGRTMVCPGALADDYEALFVRGGVHRGEDPGDSFYAEHGLGDWRPLASVDSLA